MGFFIGIANAVALAFHNAQLRTLSEINTYFLNLLRFTVGAGVLALAITASSGWQFPPRPFWFILLALLPIEVLIAFCYVRAFQRSPQSLVGPLFALTIMFLVPIGYFLLAEFPTPAGFAGITATLVGTLLLGWDFRDPGFRRALANIFREKGSYYMLAAALLSALAVALTKLSFHVTFAPLLSGFYIVAALALVHVPAVFLQPLTVLKNRKRPLLLMTGAYGMDAILHYLGLSLLLAVYYIAIKRTNIVFDVLFGYFVGHEGHTRERFFGALLMVAGVVLIAFG